MNLLDKPSVQSSRSGPFCKCISRRRKPKMGTWTKSIGTLRLNHKTKDRSPDLIGSVKMHNRLIHALLDELDETGKDVVECKIAAWQYRDKDGPLAEFAVIGTIRTTPARCWTGDHF